MPSGIYTWRLSVKVEKEQHDYIEELALRRFGGSWSKAIRHLLTVGAEHTEELSSKASFQLARYEGQLERKREMVIQLRKIALDLKVQPDSEREALAKEAALEEGVLWPPSFSEEADLNLIRSRLNRLCWTNEERGMVQLSTLRRSLQRQYTLDELFGFLQVLQTRGEVSIEGNRPNIAIRIV